MKPGSLSHFLTRSFWKDMKYPFFPMMRGLLGPLVILFIIVLGFANAFVFSDENLTYRHQPEDEAPDNYQFVDINENNYDDYDDYDPFGEDDERWLITGKGATGLSFFVFLVFFLPLLVFLLMIHSMVITREIKSGNIRSFFHYGVSVRKVLNSKMLNSLLMLSILTIFSAYLTATTLIVWDLPIGLVMLAILFNFIFLAGQYAFFFSLTNLLQMTKFKFLRADPLAIILVGNIILIWITETGLYATYIAMAEMFRWSHDYPWFLIFKYLSPFHTYGVLVDCVLFGTGITIWDFIWVPIFVGVIVASIIVKKKVYPDLFIKETA